LKTIDYIESSIFLSLLFEDDFYEKAVKIWNSDNYKITSILSSIESTIVLRRYYFHNKEKLNTKWLSKNETKLREYLSECYQLNIDEDIDKIIHAKKQIADCRSLDGIHVGSALYFKNLVSNTSIIMNSFDKRINLVANSLGIKTHAV
jgi:predicted transcriptional regulator